MTDNERLTPEATKRSLGITKGPFTIQSAVLSTEVCSWTGHVSGP